MAQTATPPAHLHSPSRAADRWSPPVKAIFKLQPPASPPGRASRTDARRPLASPRRLPFPPVRGALNCHRHKPPRLFFSRKRRPPSPPIKC
jgi:hypothetical protein